MSEHAAVFVNEIAVDPEHLDAVLAVLKEGLDEFVSHRPGFRSAELLVDVTGTRVLNVARWASPADVAATREDPAGSPYVTRVAELAGTVTPGLFRVVHVRP